MNTCCAWGVVHTIGNSCPCWAKWGDSVGMILTRRLPPPLLAALLCLVTLTAPPRAEAETRWSWPIVGPIIRPFDKPENDYSDGHRGIDVGALRGRAIRAPADAVVWFVGRVAGKDVVSLDTADGSIVSMEPVEASVSRGDVVRRGDPVGLVSGQHDGMNAVHIGVRVDGVYVDPTRFLGKPPRIVIYESRLEGYALG